MIAVRSFPEFLTLRAYDHLELTWTSVSLWTCSRRRHTAVMGPEWDPAALIERLRDDLGHRRIGQGIEALRQARPMLDVPQPASGLRRCCAGLMAQWVDAGFDEPAPAAPPGGEFPKRSGGPAFRWRTTCISAWRKAVLAMADEDFEAPLPSPALVQSSRRARFGDPELAAIANFWLGRCYRRTGRYGEALKYTQQGEALALACGYPQMAAVMQATRSWLAFQQGKLQEAARAAAAGRGSAGRDGRLHQPRQHSIRIRPHRAAAG